MPIFHDPDDGRPRHASANTPATTSPVGLRYRGVDLKDEPSDALTSEHATGTHSRSGLDPVSLAANNRRSIFNRAELIERIKRSNTPSRTPHPNNNGMHTERSPEPRQTVSDRPVTPLLPAAELTASRTSSPDPLQNNASAGLEIERPRSALHSGDFREKKDDGSFNHASLNAPLATSPVAPWHQFQSAARSSTRHGPQFAFRDVLSYESRPSVRSRAASQSSFSSSFVLMPPTSPLVQQSNNPDLDSRPGSRHSSRSPDRNSRRHTFSPHSFQTFRSMQFPRSISGTPLGHMKSENPFPYQAHQPRRSLTSLNQSQSHAFPQTPFVESRSPSFSEASPLHHAPMVGSYEESILRGRMSTTPSRPLNFVAQIGVLGKGQCKPNLRCPPHVTVPFPAVFYSYNSGNGLLSDNSPSPYVGLIDLENNLAPPEDSGDGSRRRRRHTVPHPEQDDVEGRPGSTEERPTRSKGELRRREKMKRRSTSPKAPPGGSYRIPQQGQLQIVIKNPNKTAVKLFLVPYDLSDMEPGQKTFIRQRSYSAGPIIDMPLSSRKNLGTDRPEAAISNSDDPNDRPILRYLIHLHICCPSKGRFFIYKGIRVVFANRVPDGKEKLRNEIQLPEPRYSAYKPNRDSQLLHTTSSSVAMQLNTEKAMRRRSAGFPLTRQAYDRVDGLTSKPPVPPPAIQFSGGYDGPNARFGSPMPALGSIPFNLSPDARMDSERDGMDMDEQTLLHAQNIDPGLDSLAHEPDSPLGNRSGSFEKLSKGDAGYGGSGGLGAGLLARRLRGLDVQRDGKEE